MSKGRGPQSKDGLLAPDRLYRNRGSMTPPKVMNRVGDTSGCVGDLLSLRDLGGLWRWRYRPPTGPGAQERSGRGEFTDVGAIPSEERREPTGAVSITHREAIDRGGLALSPREGSLFQKEPEQMTGEEQLMAS